MFSQNCRCACPRSRCRSPGNPGSARADAPRDTSRARSAMGGMPSASAFSAVASAAGPWSFGAGSVPVQPSPFVPISVGKAEFPSVAAAGHLVRGARRRGGGDPKRATFQTQSYTTKTAFGRFIAFRTDSPRRGTSLLWRIVNIKRLWSVVQDQLFSPRESGLTKVSRYHMTKIKATGR